jgi:hypothetical protein
LTQTTFIAKTKMIETEDKVEEKVVLRRVPPGDRWETADSKRQFSNLTSALDYVYGSSGVYDFSIYARKGIVCIKNVVQIEKPVTKYSLYGEE